MRLLFPTVFHEISIKNFKSIKRELIDFVYDQRQRDSAGVECSNIGGWQSQDVYHQGDNIIRSTVLKTIQPYFKKILRNGGEVELANMWLNINKKGDYNSTHNHPRSHLSGVLWIKTPNHSGHFEMQSPHAFECGHEIGAYNDTFQEKTGSYDYYYLLPTEGNIVIFPSYLNHKVKPNESDEDRISVAFNLWSIVR